METKLRKGVLALMVLGFAMSIQSQTLNIGNFTSLKVSGKVIYVAGQSGIAALKPDLSVIWEKQLPETTIRLLEVTDKYVAYCSYVYVGREAKLLSSFSSLWDKVTFTDDVLGVLDLNGTEKWTSRINGATKMSYPAVDKDIITLMSNDSLYIFNLTNGNLKSKTFVGEKIKIGKNIFDHFTPNQPLIANNAIYAATSSRLSLIDLEGNITKQKVMYGIFSALQVMNAAPIFFQNQIFLANSPTGQRGQKDGVTRLFNIKENLDKDWDEFVDANGNSGTGASSLIHNNSTIFVATNFDVMAFTPKGKKVWENKKDIGLPLLRGLSYSGFISVKKSNGNFLCADENAVYIASGKKVKKDFIQNITILDVVKGKLVKTIDVAETIVDMALLDNSIIVITEANKVLVLDK
jgi:hypothetical protein